MLKYCITPTVLIAITASSGNAEGLERVNIDTGFLFADGTSADFSTATITPSFNATDGSASFSFDDSRNLTPSFSATTFSIKVPVSNGLDVGIWSTSQGNGVDIDYGIIQGAGATGAVANGTHGAAGGFNVKAELSIPTFMLAARYELNENVSLIAGAKYVNLDGGQLKLGSNFDADPFVDGTSVWDLGSDSGVGAVVGAAYEIEDIALRVSIVHEDSIDLQIDTTAPGTPYATTAGVDGVSKASIGDATTLAFQTGIAEDTLLFGSVRQSNWENNQVYVPSIAASGHSKVSSFEDGNSYTVGLGRKFTEKFSGSISYFLDEGDGDGASELSPSGGVQTLSLGGKFNLSEQTSISFGASYSERGDALTGSYSASVKGSTVTSFGIKLSTTF